MSAALSSKWSLRLERAESVRLVRALTFSLLLHAVVFGGYYAGKKYDLWNSIHWPRWMQHAKYLAEKLAKKKEPPTPQPLPEPPLLFVEVSPTQETVEPPKETPYYSSRNSQAANPEPLLDSNIPNISGKQKEIVQTQDAPREKFLPLQPTPKPAPPAMEPQEEVKAPPSETKLSEKPKEQPKEPPKVQPPAETKPEVAKTPDEQKSGDTVRAKPPQKPGDLAMVKPEQTAPKVESPTPKPRPRTIKEALANKPSIPPPSQMLSQEGGVRRRLEISAVDARATPFGAYDEALIAAIRNCWFNLLDQQNYAADYRGRDVLHFRLHQDGRITDVSVEENTAGPVPALLCQAAVDKPNPYPPFPSDMRRVAGETRNIQFTFYYN